MKKNLKYISGYNLLFLSTVFFCSFFTSCSKMVDVDLPNNQVTQEAAFISNDQATSVIAGIYSQLMTNTAGAKVFSNGGATLYGGLSADELETYMGVSDIIDYPYYSNKLLRDDVIAPSVIWVPAFKVIFNCNSAIEGINASTSASLDAATRRQLIGEAKFIRALSYFYLVNFFGDIPMPLVSDFNQTSQLRKSATSEVYAQIITDLKDAQTSLPSDFAVSASNERVRANKWAATALLARVYLYTKDYQNAELQASAVISNPLFATGTLDNAFLKNSSETIFALKQNVTSVPYGGTHDANSFVPIQLLGLYPPASQASLLSNPATYSATSLLFFPNFNMTAQLANAFETGDLRKTRWAQSWASPAQAPYNSRTFYAPYKYKVKAGSAAAANNEFYIVLRISEQYLIRAEARAQQGNLAGAVADLVPIRTRAGLGPVPTTNQTQVLDAILHERQVELFAEWGHRWLDLKRTGKAEAVLSIIPDKQPWSNAQLLYPIPQGDIDNNPRLIQNPGYE